MNAQNTVSLPSQMKEISGVSLSGDTLVWINDGGHPPALHFTTVTGSYLESQTLPIINLDWEAMTKDSEGNFYIGDVGNNQFHKAPKKIYIVRDNFTNIDSSVFTYPTSLTPHGYPDVEAMVWFHNRIHIFTKQNAPASDVKNIHYTLRTDLPVQEAQWVEETSFYPFLPTDAAISPDGKHLIILAYRYKFIFGLLPDSDVALFIYSVKEDTNEVFDSKVKRVILPTWFATRQYESIVFVDDDHVIIGAEGRNKLQPIMKKIKVKKYLTAKRG